MIQEFNIFRIPKGNGKFRKIYEPLGEYKKTLIKVNKKISNIVLINDYFQINHAFIKQRNCITNAKKHIKFDYTYSMDLTDFFDTVTPDMVSEYLKDEYLELCFVDGFLRQGLPSSPSIANLSLLNADKDINSRLRELNYNISYTRYADDLTVSFNDISLLPAIKTILINNIESKGFVFNESKTKLQKGSNGRRIITGVGVDRSGVYPTRKIIKKIRAAKHQKNVDSLRGLEEWAKCKIPNRKY